jgi:hypothetical protein
MRQVGYRRKFVDSLEKDHFKITPPSLRLRGITVTSPSNPDLIASSNWKPSNRKIYLQAATPSFDRQLINHSAAQEELNISWMGRAAKPHRATTH